jgi:hypothetical protein
MILTQNTARLIDPADRAALGPAAQLNSEAGTGARHRSEIAQQKIFANWLKIQKRNGRLAYVWHGTHKKSTATVGTPDFIVAVKGPKTLWLEFKAPGNSCTPEQEQTLALLDSLGHAAHILPDADSAIRLVKVALATL